MSSVDMGGPAFPGFGQYADNEGMTLRDYFAAKATDEDVRDQGEVIRARQQQIGGMGILPEGWRTIARYMHADAMLEARSK